MDIDAHDCSGYNSGCDDSHDACAFKVPRTGRDKYHMYQNEKVIMQLCTSYTMSKTSLTFRVLRSRVSVFWVGAEPSI